MSFQGTSFIFNGVPSEQYGLIVTKLGTEEETFSAGANVNPITDKTLRSAEFELLGVEQSEPLSFSIEFSSQKPLDAFNRSAINLWLFGQKKYCDLQICQRDLRNFYYHCFLTDPEFVYYDNYAYSIRANVVCDAPWAWEYPRTKRWSFPDTQFNKIRFLNLSNDSNDTLPQVSFTLTRNNTKFTVINHSYNDRRFEWTGLQGGETISVDCKTGIIISSTGLRRADNFNKKFLRLINGNNDLECIGTVSDFAITYRPVRKVGG